MQRYMDVTYQNKTGRSYREAIVDERLSINPSVPVNLRW
jgi:hypothetical protein